MQAFPGKIAGYWDWFELLGQVTANTGCVHTTINVFSQYGPHNFGMVIPGCIKRSQCDRDPILWIHPDVALK